MTQPVPNFGPVKILPLEPACSPQEAKEKFEGLYLDRDHIKHRLTESTHVVTPEGETKFLYLKQALPKALVARTWQDLQNLKFNPAKNSRRRALKGSMGGELLLGWIDFAQRSMGIAPMLTAETRNQWPEFRALWPLLWTFQYLYNRHLPGYAEAQAKKAAAARESVADFLLRNGGIEAICNSDSRTLTSKDDIAEELRRMEVEQPDLLNQIFVMHLAETNPEYLDKLLQRLDDEDQGFHDTIPLGLKDGNIMMGHTVPGTMFSTITVNRTALFRAHEDGNNLAGALSCLAAFGKFSGGELCFPRYGVSCPLDPGDLLIGDTNREQHGNIGPLMGNRISVVTYMRDALVSAKSGGNK